MEKVLFCITFCLLVVVIGLIVYVAIASQTNENLTHNIPEICTTSDCAEAAARILESLDMKVDPCSDFYLYACGAWKKTNVIPEDKSAQNVFGVLRDNVQVINKYLLEDKNKYNTVSLQKAKDLYAACVNLDLIENKNFSIAIPLLQELGGWPVLGNNQGGNWNESDFDFVDLLVTLRKYSYSPVLNMYVSQDVKASENRIIYLDQPEFGLPGRNYYLDEKLSDMLEAYLVLAKSVAQLFGANNAEEDMKTMLDLEIQLANISVKAEDRRDNELLYNKMTIAQMAENFTEPNSSDPIQFNWMEYFKKIMAIEGINITINETESVVVRSVSYFEKLFQVLQHYTKKDIANYLVWYIMKNRANNLPKRFTDLITTYNAAISGTLTSRARWRQCEEYVTNQMGMAVGHMFVKETFDESAKSIVESIGTYKMHCSSCDDAHGFYMKSVETAGKPFRLKEFKNGNPKILFALDMIRNIRVAFNELLDELEWMDGETKVKAREKAAAIRNWIGYPDEILNTEKLNEIYVNVTANSTEYFHNVLDYLKLSSVVGLRDLRKKYDKNIWTTPPSTVNAFYSSTLNNIMFPAGILQPPFYSKEQPKSMNYGGIGVVIGHEITHGFDDRGRQYDKDGNLHEWWDQTIIEEFKKKAECIVNQYAAFNVTDANLNVNGINTQGENIADNGGLKQSFRAYRRWVEQQGKEEPLLPGLNFTHNQLFFINFAQIWCNNMRKEAMINAINTGVHSPGEYRVIGTLQNSPDFAKAFDCPHSSYMHPVKKCYVW